MFVPLTLFPFANFTTAVVCVCVCFFFFFFFCPHHRVAQSILHKAAKHLTPVCLELGGKSPAYVDASANLAVAARRIAWGRFVNAGQICVAPDYVLCHAAVRDRFLAEVRNAVRSMYGTDPKTSKYFAVCVCADQGGWVGRGVGMQSSDNNHEFILYYTIMP
jgi:Aldehyde dehydrogenase family